MTHNGRSPSRREVLAGGLATAALASSGAWAQGAGTTNVLLIVAGDLGYGCLGCNGGTTYPTPALDRMASEGARFTAAFSQPIAATSTMRLLTGRYEGHQREDRGYSDIGLTFATLLRTAGHATVAVGEWGFKGGYQRTGALGFDAWSLWNIGGRGSRYWSPMVVQDGKARRRTRRAYGPDVHRRYLLDFMERHASQPFLAWYPMLLAHDPLCPTPNSEGERSDANRDVAYYAEMVAYLDQEVSELLDALDRLGLSERTLVLFTAGNGSAPLVTYQVDGHSVIGGKGRANTWGTHVPLLARWPGTIAPGLVVDDLVDFVDFLPTIAGAAGAKLPKVPLDGRSFLPRLLGQTTHPRRWVYGELSSKGEVVRWTRDQRWLLFEDGRFYDTVADPAQRTALRLEALDAEAVVAWSALEGALIEAQR